MTRLRRPTTLLLCSMLLLLIFPRSAATAGALPSSVASECSEPETDLLRRAFLYSNPAQLSSFYARVRSGQPVTIVALGGSITGGGKASSPEKRYPNRLATKIGEYFGVEVNLINAGIGATGSLLGVFRLELHVLQYNPDLVVLEFSINDFYGSPIQRIAHEDLIRRLVVAGTPTIELFMMNGAGLNSQDWELGIAEHYGVPAISYRDAYYPLVESGVISWNDIAADNLHPNDAGHENTSQLLFEYIRLCEPDAPSPPPEPQPLPLPMYGDDFDTTRIYQPYGCSGEILVNQGFAVIDKPMRNFFGGYGLESAVPGSTFEFRFRGTSFGFAYYTMESPFVNVYLDGQFIARVEAGPPLLAWVKTALVATKMKDELHIARLVLSEGQDLNAPNNLIQLNSFLIGTGSTLPIGVPVQDCKQYLPALFFDLPLGGQFDFLR